MPLFIDPSEPPDRIVCQHCRGVFRAITYTHLFYGHGYTGEHPVRDYKERFGVPKASCLEVREVLSENKAEYWDDRGLHWTPRRVLAAIQQRRRAGESLRMTEVPDNLQRAGIECFGSWAKAIGKAGLDYDTITAARRWDRDKVLREIRKLAADGVPLFSVDIERNYGGLFLAATRMFPYSWAKALKAAGLDPNEHKKPRGRWNSENAAAWVQRRIAKGQSLVTRAVPLDLFNFVRLRLGKKWSDYVESFGIPYPGTKKRLDWTKDKVLEEVKSRAAQGQPMNYKALERSEPKLLRQAVKFFKSWDAARGAAGIEIVRVSTHPPQKGRPPRSDCS